MQNHTPAKEIKSRLKRYNEFLQRFIPHSEGSLIFSRLNIYYFTGTFANGVLWLPKEGDPILLCRRGTERAKIESPLANIVPFNSYGDLKKTFNEFGIAIPTNIAAEMNGLPWSLSNSLMKNLPHSSFLPSDKIIAMTRAKKTEWELQILRETGEKHDNCLTHLLPLFLREGMNELQISHKISEIFFSEGHQGVLRMNTFGEEVFLGHIAIGDSANYPSFFNGPVGLRGIHPAAPFMGSSEIEWKTGYPLIVDNGFSMSGYQTDKTQVYWLGNKNTIPAIIQDAHNFCVEIQAMIAERLKPGAIPSNLWKECEEMVSRSPWAEGFMGIGNNKVSFIGHGIGLAIDEYPVLAHGFDSPLEDGMVLAIEPKIGIPGIGMVGTENTFEVATNGCRVLTGSNYDIITI